MIDSKYDIKIADLGLVVGRHTKLLTHLYTRDEAPAFVNKFSSGDPNYRDATFFSTWVQLDWMNGFNQEFFDDPSRFFYSEGLDTTTLQQLTLEKAFNSTGVTGDGTNVQTEVAWRSPGLSYFGNGADGALSIAADTTDAPIDSACTGTQGTNSLTATNVSFAANQEILIHQTRGTGAGGWQRTKIASYTAGTITTTNPLTMTYATGAQVIVLKQYTTVTVASTKIWTAKAWDGTVGGILCFLATGLVTITGTITATGKGFRGGAYQNNTGIQGESGTGAGGTTTAKNGMGGGGGSIGTSSGAGGGGGGGHAAAGTIGNGENTPGAAGDAGGNAALTSLVFGGAGGSGGWRTESSYPTYHPGAGGNSGGIILIMGTTVSLTGTVTTNGVNGGDNTDSGKYNGGGGGGAGGAVLIKAQTATLGTNLITCAAGTGGYGRGAASYGGPGSVGRIHIDYLTSYTGTASPTIDYAQDTSLTTTLLGASYTSMVGTAAGKIYSWDGTSTYTELFDVNKLEWYESGGDAYRLIGNNAGEDGAVSQGFKLDEATYISSIQVYLKKNAGTPGDITVRIETDAAAKPSGTLADAGLTATIPAFTTTDWGWITATFATPIQLAKATLFHIVLKTAAVANGNNYFWQFDDSSPTYSDGACAYSVNGGSTWTALSTSDGYFRVLGESVGVTCSIVSDIAAATSKVYFGTGNFASAHVGNARIYSYDGTTWALTKVLTGTTDSSIGSMLQFGTLTPGVFIGVGHKAKVYYTADMATFTVSKIMTEPRQPGYVLALAEYNGQLMAGGGYPEQLFGSGYQYSGFLYYYDEYAWGMVGTFEHTVVTCLESFDTMLFIGTIKKRLYVYNTATIDKLFEFPWDVQISSMRKWDDKLALAIAPRPGVSPTGHEGVYLFDRNGLHCAFKITDRSWYSLFVFNNNLIAGGDAGNIYITDSAHYQATGWLQTSYFEASLPSIDKLYKEIIVQHDIIPTGCSYEVLYKFKESDSWTSLGTASTAGEIEHIFSFAVNIYTKKITIKIVLSTTDTAVTPTIKKQLTKYQIAPDVKYIWKMTIVCPDNMVWGDNTVPIAKIGTGCTAGDTTLILDSIAGFPDPNGSTMYASVILADDSVDTFSYTEIDVATKTLTGIPATGTYALATHAAGLKVKVLGRDIHRALLDLKRTKKFYTLTDVDGLTYTVYFSSYQTDNWVIDVATGSNLIENEVPITLLEA